MALPALDVNVKIRAAHWMTVTTKVSAKKDPALCLRILHVIQLRPDKQMIGVDAERVVTAMASHHAFGYVDRKMRGVSRFASLKPTPVLPITTAPASDRTKPQPATRVRLGDAMALEALRWGHQLVRSHHPLL